MQITTEVKFIFNTIEHRDIFFKSFLPEFKGFNAKRSSWQIYPINPDSAHINFQIQAEDATAFRATINSLIQFASVVEKTLNLVE
ncbi:MAG: hypothetical protein DRO88_00340 [Promethearchaeia archaeon]|nr:MAG: hypothetical protein DRO88_00340 [Candidatus Lokiarchaeia archaeon]